MAQERKFKRSPEDLRATGRLLRGPLLDHLVIASRERWLSLRSVIVSLGSQGNRGL